MDGRLTTIRGPHRNSLNTKQSVRIAIRWLARGTHHFHFIRSTLHGALEGEGFEVTERTIQRDLNELSLAFPLAVDDREKPYGWSWQKDAPSFNLPGLTIPESLTLSMAEQHLKSLLPSSMMTQPKPYFDAAHKRLDAEPQPHRGRSWLWTRCVPFHRHSR